MIGITATVPVEIIFAAGMRPVDINNIFITSDNPSRLVSQAEAAGFSHNTCSWIKGIYSTVIARDIKEIIAVTGGDCSNTIPLAELLARNGIRIYTFHYPHDRDREGLWSQMDKLRKALGADWHDIKEVKSRLDRVRGKLKRLDYLTWREDVVSGLENHLFLVTASDFNGDPNRFENELDLFLADAEKRTPFDQKIRLGYLGVPPIFGRFYEFIESVGGRVVFNEVQRQFSMPFECDDIVNQYLEYTYPYDMAGRLRDIEQAVTQRRLHGLIHYTQTFCYRQIYDIILRQEARIPILTLEGDRPGLIDGRTCLRIETFVEMLKERQSPAI
ncbi:2-hydroxyglutaryl-CoA dehydratase, D-component [uncultured Desulfobacterium sp.]|uniref:2-hydroxyglutaryl-CoA dehydratase, D-component n=1 Tax=uncultured Desulfobacterium sp. TaxID=201089 RepID=A0A445MTD3_9BACT|nr:2-hydroxyglutaryl-CoA dehydratase, D-component [uncultured Desulfobacterium sp.]